MAGCFYVLDQNPVRETVDPRHLQADGSFESLPSLFGQNDEVRPTVMRVGVEFDQPFAVQVVDDPLHVLPIGSKAARKPRELASAMAEAPVAKMPAAV